MEGVLAMANLKIGLDVQAGEAQITLALLRSVADNSAVTQRSLANDLGIALGLANAYLKKCAKKGLIKFREVPANRYAYFLTPQGFAEKSRLTAEYLGQSFSLFRRARQEYSLLFDSFINEGNTSLAIFGGSDLTEIILLCARDFSIDIVGIVATEFESNLSTNIKIVENVVDLAPFDSMVLAELGDPQAAYDGLIKVLNGKKILTPDFMNISTHKIQLLDDGEPV